MDLTKLEQLATEGKEASLNEKEFRALAEKREREGLHLSAAAALESAASWRRKIEAVKAAILAEIEKA